MGTEDESTLTLQGRATAAAGAALVAACIVNPLDVIKVGVCWACMPSLPHARQAVADTAAAVLFCGRLPPQTRIQAQAMAEASGQRSGCSTPWTCTSTLYE